MFRSHAIARPLSIDEAHVKLSNLRNGVAILHLFGIDHLRLTYRYQGRDFRLTDVAGNVVKAILA
jgi:Protein of unknown function (DUF1501)